MEIAIPVIGSVSATALLLVLAPVGLKIAYDVSVKALGHFAKTIHYLAKKFFPQFKSVKESQIDPYLF